MFSPMNKRYLEKFHFLLFIGLKILPPKRNPPCGVSSVTLLQGQGHGRTSSRPESDCKGGHQESHDLEEATASTLSYRWVSSTRVSPFSWSVQSGTNTPHQLFADWRLVFPLKLGFIHPTLQTIVALMLISGHAAAKEPEE